MNPKEGRPFTVKTTVTYTDVDGSTKSIQPGAHWIVPVWAKDVPTGETELECWIVKENKGTEREVDHDVDAETVLDWQANDAVAFD